MKMFQFYLLIVSIVQAVFAAAVGQVLLHLQVIAFLTTLREKPIERTLVVLSMF